MDAVNKFRVESGEKRQKIEDKFMPHNIPETLYNEAKLLDKGQMPAPRAAYLTPTYRCNQNCYYCFYKEWNNKGIPEKPENIFKIIDQLKDMGVKSIEFEGGGDPLMTDGIEEIFNYCSGLGIKMGLLTNGVLFEGSIAETYLKMGTYVRISMDTVNPELYKKIRGTDDFAKVSNNIKKALEIKKSAKYECQISIKCGVSRDIGYEEIQELCDYFKGKDIYSIQVKNLWDKEGRNYRNDIDRNGEVGRTKNSVPVINKIVYSKFMHEQCWITPVQIATDVFGDFYLCVYYMHRKETLKVGNMLETPLKELWGSRNHRDTIADIKISECMKHDCRFKKYMMIIRKLERNGEWEFL